MHALKIFGIIILGLTALFTGGCSFIFALGALFERSGSGIGLIDFWPIWGGGLVIAALCIWAVRAIARSLRDAQTESATGPHDDPPVT